MSNPGAAALLLDRLASNAAASFSGVSVAGTPWRRLARGPRCQPQQAACVGSQLGGQLGSRFCREAVWREQTLKRLQVSQLPQPFRRRPRLRESTGSHSSLSKADYTVYQDMPEEDITEEFLWERLRPLLGYLSEDDVLKVREALSLASDAHAGQRRKSGEPFITHPLEVARLLAEIHMDKESLIAGLLHDTVEDNPAQITFEEIGIWFGQAVRSIVEGETKFSKIGQLSSDDTSSADVKAHDLQHLFLAMTKEVRIIVVKLADRLHNMRTLGSMPALKQRKIAEETLQVFAPLARLLGLYSIKEELEELGFSYSKPDEYMTIRRRLDQLIAEQSPVVQQAKAILEDMLQSDAYLSQRAERVEIISSQKSVYSIYRKLEESQCSADDVVDVAQLCVVLHLQDMQNGYLYGTGSQLCYHVMGLVHTKWAPIPGSIKDYIATPKRNGYQSLHTTVLPLGSTPLFPLEVQIRTSKMQELAEFGIAGEKWNATHTQSSSFDTLDLDSDAEPQSQQAPAGAGTVVGGILKMLPGLWRFSNEDAFAFNLPVNGSDRRRPGQVSGRLGPSVAATAVSGAFGSTRSPVEPKNPSRSVTIRPVGAARLDRDVLKRREHWLKSIIEWQREFVDSLSAREFVDGITDDLLGRGVFVFTPSGDLMRLPKDSTTVDFAYHVHTDVGNQMVGAKVNGKLVSPAHLLSNAEVVEILTYNGPPTSLSVVRHHEWSSFAKSKTARHKLAKFLKDNARLLPEHLRTAAEGPPGEDDVALGGADAAVWLDVEGEEGPGLLAELARIIARHGVVKTYSGTVNSTAGTLRMRFEVLGIRGRCDSLCAEIGSAPRVRSLKLVDDDFGLRRQPA